MRENIKVGKGTVIWHYTNLYGCEIGEDCVISSFVEIGKDVKIGNRCKIECGAFIPTGVIIEDDVFIGPHVCFTNDLFPRTASKWNPISTLVKKGASIGANATIRCGVMIGKEAMVGCGAVVVENVPDYAIVVGNPAHIIGHTKGRR